jgi:hypothetical protein
MDSILRNEKQKRETADREYTVFSDGPPPLHMTGDWSDWIKVLPSDTGELGEDAGRIAGQLPPSQYGNASGLYEVMIKKPKSLNHVVYADHAVDVSESVSKLNTSAAIGNVLGRSLSDGYMVFIRVQFTQDHNEAITKLNRLKEVYDYSWDKQ